MDVARICAAEARRIIRDGFGHVGVSHYKGRGNVLTETDLAVEHAITAILRREYPDHTVLSEETAADTRSEGWMWVVDPIDGTKNFSRGIPHFCFTMALCRGEEPLVALTLQPLLDEEYAAVANEGCTLNGRPVTVSDCSTVADSILAMDLGYADAAGRQQLELVLGIWPGVQSLRISGSAALGFAHVAAGRWDVYVHRDLQPWDLAAGLLLVREAGGVVTTGDGAPGFMRSPTAIAAGPAVHADFVSLAAGRPRRA
jgi:fructose-1,6-bisphosphatase/inositol monophosphatase family enzyme